MDVLVKWDKDGTKNVVSSDDLVSLDGGRFITGTRVTMLWNDVFWEGTVELTEDNIQETMRDISSQSDDSDPDDNIPLALQAKRSKSE